MRNDEAIPLRPKVFDTLLVLVQNSGRLLSKREMMDLIWQKSFVEEGNLTQYIYTIRKLLGESHYDHQFVVTIPGSGYKFVANVKVVYPNDSSRDIWASLNREKNQYSESVKSIAILPLKVLSLDKEDKYLGVGIADALITRLNSIRGIVVRPTTSVLKYSDSEHNPLAAGHELDVDTVLDGTVQKVGDKIRVSVQLLLRGNKRLLWADAFDADFTNIFSVQDSIAEKITEKLALELSAEEKKNLTKKYIDNIEAYRLYIKGRYFWDKRTKEGLNKGVEFAKQIIELDGNFAPAYVGIADSYALMGEYLYLSPYEAFPKAEEAALKALEIDDTLAEAYASLAEIALFHEWDWAKSENLYHLAIEKNPNYSSAHHWYAWFLMTQKRFDEARNRIKDALIIDPGSLTLNTVRGLPDYFEREYGQAVKQFKQVLEMEPDFPQAHYYLGEAFLQQKLYKEAIAEFEKIKSAEYLQQTLALLGYTYAVSKQEKRAKQILKRLNEMSGQRYVSPYCEAIIYAGLEEKENAFASLERAFENRASWMIFLDIDPWFDNLRSDSRFSDLLKKMQLGG